MSYKFFVRILSSKNLLYRDYYGRTHLVPIGSVHREVKAMSCHDAYFTLLRRVVEEYLEEMNITRANIEGDKDLHYIQVAQFYSMLSDYDILNSVDVYHGDEWLKMTELPPGNIYLKDGKKSKGTKKFLARKKAGRKRRSELGKFQLSFDDMPRLLEASDSEE